MWRYKPYVPVAKRREQATKKMAKLKKQGHNIQPVHIEGKMIATTFWGKAWCSHIEAFSDYENRLPRGRTYVRNGSVCHLEIKEEAIQATVSGGDLYQITITVKSLPHEKWQAVKDRCSGQIGSLLDLLAGKLSSGVMDVVCHQTQGLFPLAGDIKLSCSCPDWADMCKHVAAALYGVGARLDSDPSALFRLRGVNVEDLIDIEQAVTKMTTSSGKGRRLSTDTVSTLFDLDITPAEMPFSEKITSDNVNAMSTFPKILTGTAILKKRTNLKLSKTAFAKTIGITPALVTTWENQARKKIIASEKSLMKLRVFWENKT